MAVPLAKARGPLDRHSHACLQPVPAALRSCLATRHAPAILSSAVQPCGEEAPAWAKSCVETGTTALRLADGRRRDEPPGDDGHAGGLRVWAGHGARGRDDGAHARRDVRTQRRQRRRPLRHDGHALRIHAHAPRPGEPARPRSRLAPAPVVGRRGRGRNRVASAPLARARRPAARVCLRCVPIRTGRAVHVAPPPAAPHAMLCSKRR